MRCFVRSALILAAILTGILAAPASAERRVLFSCPANGITGQFDPMIAHGQEPFGHHHTFAGNTAVSSDATLYDLLHGQTSCNVASDKSAIWIPSMLVDGLPVAPNRVSYYYIAKPDAGTIFDVPNGLRFVGGKPANETASQSAGVWRCTTSSGTYTGVSSRTIPTTCPMDAVTFQVQLYMGDCWNARDYGPGFGGSSGPANGRSHVSTDAASAQVPTADQICDDAEVLALPAILLTVRFPLSALSGRLSSDHVFAPAGTSYHADYVFVWGEGSDGDLALPKIIDHCLDLPDPGANTTCKVSPTGEVSTTYGTPVFVTD